MYTNYLKAVICSFGAHRTRHIELLINMIDFRMFAYEVTPGAYLNTNTVFKVQIGWWFIFTFVLSKLFSRGEKVCELHETVFAVAKRQAGIEVRSLRRAIQNQ